LIHSVRTMGR